MQALHMGSAEQMQRGPSRPWQLGWQMDERNLVWNDELKLRLIKLRSQHAGCSRCKSVLVWTWCTYQQKQVQRCSQVISSLP